MGSKVRSFLSSFLLLHPSLTLLVLTFLVLDQPLSELQSDKGGSVQDDVGDALPAVRRQAFCWTDKVPCCIVDDHLHQSGHSTESLQQTGLCCEGPVT